MNIIKIILLFLLIIGIGCIVFDNLTIKVIDYTYIPEKIKLIDILPITTIKPIDNINIGFLYIPILKQRFPIVQGTEMEDLKKGVGHFLGSVMPGESDNCVLSGHRDTVFARLGELVIGDNLIIETSTGIYTYKIKLIRIVDEDDRTVIVPYNHAVLTLTTCYPFNFIGNAPKRYIIVADLLF